MKVIQTRVLVRDLMEGYHDYPETNQVVGLNGQLQIRAPYNRQFVYNGKQQEEVIRTVRSGFPLSVMYWGRTDDGWEIIDGQQRTMSICHYIQGDFAVDYRFYHNLTKDEKDVILNYELDVYQCIGTESEKLSWFRVINTVGEKLTPQELRNAAYNGPWVSAAKKKFSIPNSPAYRIAKDYLSGTAIRQEYLETAISWIASRDGQNIEEYMAIHQPNEEDVQELWDYFEAVINWAKQKFTTYRREMKGLPWGLWYNECMRGEHKGQIIDQSPAVIEAHIKDLLDDDEVQSIKGIYAYIVTGLEKNLNLRQFDVKVARKVYERQNHKCPYCEQNIGGHSYKQGKTEWEFEEMEADHIVPWNAGGKTVEDNCQMLCKYHNGNKGG